MSITVNGGDKMPGRDGTGPLGTGSVCNRRFGGRMSGRSFYDYSGRGRFSHTPSFIRDQEFHTGIWAQTDEKTTLEEQARFYENQLVDLKKRMEQIEKQG